MTSTLLDRGDQVDGLLETFFHDWLLEPVNDHGDVVDVLVGGAGADIARTRAVSELTEDTSALRSGAGRSVRRRVTTGCIRR